MSKTSSIVNDLGAFTHGAMRYWFDKRVDTVRRIVSAAIAKRESILQKPSEGPPLVKDALLCVNFVSEDRKGLTGVHWESASNQWNTPLFVATDGSRLVAINARHNPPTAMRDYSIPVEFLKKADKNETFTYQGVDVVGNSSGVRFPLEAETPFPDWKRVEEMRQKSIKHPDRMTVWEFSLGDQASIKEIAAYASDANSTMILHTNGEASAKRAEESEEHIEWRTELNPKYEEEKEKYKQRLQYWDEGRILTRGAAPPRGKKAAEAEYERTHKKPVEPKKPKAPDEFKYVKKTWQLPEAVNFREHSVIGLNASFLNECFTLARKVKATRIRLETPGYLQPIKVSFLPDPEHLVVLHLLMPIRVD